MKLRKLFLSAGFLIAASTSSYAGYTLHRIKGAALIPPDFTLVQGRTYFFRLQTVPVNQDLVTITVTGPNNQNDLVSSQLFGGNDYLPDSTGKVDFSLRLHHGATTLSISAVNTQDSGDQLPQNNLVIEKFPTHFTVSPPLGSVNAGSNQTIVTLTVKNPNKTVTAYEDGVKIWNRWQGKGNAITISSSAFVNGVASNISIPITVGAFEDIFNVPPISDGQNQLVIEHDGTAFYDVNNGPSFEASTATYTTAPFDVIPGPYNRVVQLFPGERLNPGPQGKDPSGIINQTAGTKVSEVRVIAVDQYNNPTSQSLPSTIEFLPVLVPLEQSPSPQPMPGTGVLRITDSHPEAFLFQSSQVYDITARPDGDNTKEDISHIPVDQGPTSGYNWVTLPQQNPPTPYTTDTALTVAIEALDGNNQRDVAVDGIIAGAQLWAQIVDLSGNVTEQKTEWVDTNTALNSPTSENMEIVPFTNGIATATINITKKATRIQLMFIDSLGNAATSYLFNIDHGNLARIHYTILGVGGVGGEKFEPGVYPGNTNSSALMNLNIIAGQDVVVEARVTDRRWNVVSGAANTSMSVIPVSLTNGVTFYHDVTYPGSGADPAIFDATGLFVTSGGQGPFIVKFRTAGIQALGANSSLCPTCDHQSSRINILPGGYQKLAVVAPGETLQPGVDLTVPQFSDGKSGSVFAQPAGAPFSVTVHVVDQYYNIVNNGPYPRINFNLTGVGNSIQGTFPEQLNGPTRTYISAVVLQNGTDLTVYDHDLFPGGPNQTVPIPVTFGAASGFNVTMSPTGDKDAGEVFQLTIEAVDQYGTRVLTYDQTVDLVQIPDLGYNTLSVNQATFDGVTGIVTVPLAVFHATTTTHIRVSKNGVTGNSPVFTVFPEGTLSNGNAFYRRLVLLGPGEFMEPASNDGKGGGTGPGFVVGDNFNSDPIPVTIQATDSYYNPITNVSGPTVSFTSNLPFPYGQVQSADPLNGGQTSSNVILYRSDTHIISVNGAGVMSSTSSFIGLSNQLARVMTLLPGEQADAGNYTNGGKMTGLPVSTQSIGVPFTVTLHAVDEWYNPVDNAPSFPIVNNGDTVLEVFGTPNVVVLPPNQAQVGGPNKNPFNNNISTKTLIIGATGFFLVQGRDQDRTYLQTQGVQVHVQPGPIYKIAVSTNQTAGQNFPVTVTYENQGVIVSTLPARNIYLNAVNPGNVDLPATGNIIPTGPFLMVNGVANFNVSYDWVEKIRLKLTDDFAGVAISSRVAVNPSGFDYNLVLPSSATAGVDFIFSVELVDAQTRTRIMDPAYTHDVSIAVDVATNPALGHASSTQATVSNGFQNIPLRYSKAEKIRLIIRDMNDHLGHPGVLQRTEGPIDLAPNGYKNLVIIADGETWNPGVTLPNGTPHPTGKTGAPNAVNKSEKINYLVRAVDSNWNLVDIDGGQITFLDNRGMVGPGNPINQGGALSGGVFGGLIEFNQAGPVTLTVYDAANGSVLPQSVDLLVAGSQFKITPSSTNQNTCAPFTLLVEYQDELGNDIPQAGAITLEAIKGGAPAAGSLQVQNFNLNSQGKATIPNQKYTLAENMQIRVSGLDTLSDSPVISFTPTAIYYSWESVPTEVDVDTEFSVTVRAKDNTGVCQGNNVENFSRLNLALTHTGSGNLNQSTIDIQQGVGQINTLKYDKAETIKLEINDPTTAIDPPPLPDRPVTPTGDINVTAGPLATLDGVNPFTVAVGSTVVVTYVAKDGTASQNLINQQTLNFTVNPGPGAIGNLNMNGIAGSYSGKTLINGSLDVRFVPTPDAFGKMTVVVTDGDIPGNFSTSFEVTVLGIPNAPPSALGIGEDRIPLYSIMALDVAQIDQQLAVNGSGGVRQTYYREAGQPNWAVYNDLTGILPVDQARGYDLFTEPRYYTIEWYSDVCYPGNICISGLSVNGGPYSQTVLAIIEDGQLAGYPSPFNPKSQGSDNYMTIQFPMGAPGTVETDIYDLFGQKVWSNQQFVTPTATKHGSILWFGTNSDGLTVANGGYIVRVKAGGATMETKVLVVK